MRWVEIQVKILETEPEIQQQEILLVTQEWHSIREKVENSKNPITVFLLLLPTFQLSFFISQCTDTMFLSWFKMVNNIKGERNSS